MLAEYVLSRGPRIQEKPPEHTDIAHIKRKSQERARKLNVLETLTKKS